MRSKCCVLGAAQKRSCSRAHCKSGSCGSSASKPCSCSRRPLAHVFRSPGRRWACRGQQTHARATVCRHTTPQGRAPAERRPRCRRAFWLAATLESSSTAFERGTRNSPGRSCWEAATSAACCARANRAGANASPCSQPSPCRMRWQAPAPSHHKYTDCRA